MESLASLLRVGQYLGTQSVQHTELHWAATAASSSGWSPAAQPQGRRPQLSAQLHSPRPPLPSSCRRGNEAQPSDCPLHTHSHAQRLSSTDITEFATHNRLLAPLFAKEIGFHHLFAVRARQARHAIPCRRGRRKGFRCLIRFYLRQRANNVPNVSNLPEINLSQSHQAGGTRGHQNKPQGKLLG